MTKFSKKKNRLNTVEASFNCICITACSFGDWQHHGDRDWFNRQV